jgi:hypothetical protein
MYIAAELIKDEGPIMTNIAAPIGDIITVPCHDGVTIYQVPVV